ncbi:hypothetical protein HN275_19920, partial [Acinetobacter baumannii]|uniref:hypothetical protein n=1 Tax=Acinetobacter baumannii TaxID=470 RepID=UPI0018979150
AKQTALEQNILKIHQKHDIDAYFAMHDALDEILKTQRHQTAAKNLNQKIEKALNPEQQKEKQSQKQQKKREDQIKYFIGSLYIESLRKASISFSQDNSDLDKLADMIHAYLSFRQLKRNLGTIEEIEEIEAIVQRMPTTKNMNRLIETAKTDPRNPFNRTPEQ